MMSGILDSSAWMRCQLGYEDLLAYYERDIDVHTDSWYTCATLVLESSQTS